MMATSNIIEIHVCFKDKCKNTTIRVATEERSEARRIARLWGEQEGGEAVTRTIVKQEGSLPDWQIETQVVDGVKIWPPLF
jgi:hypothetical protein